MGVAINTAGTTSFSDPYAGIESSPDILAASGDLSNRREHRLGLAAAAQVLNDAGVKGLDGVSYKVSDLEAEMMNGNRTIDDVAKLHGVDPASVHSEMASYFSNGDGLGLDPTQAADIAVSVAKTVPKTYAAATAVTNPSDPTKPKDPGVEPTLDKSTPGGSDSPGYSGNIGDTFDEKSLDNVPDLLAGPDYNDPSHPSRREHRLSMLGAAQALKDAGIPGENGGAYGVADLEKAMQANGGQSIDQVVASLANANNRNPDALLLTVHNQMASYYGNGDGMELDKSTSANLALFNASLVPTGDALAAATSLSAMATSNNVTLPIPA